MSKLYALCSGGDWADADVCHVIVPDGVDMEEAHKDYQRWMHEVWFKDREKGTKYYRFKDWLIKKYGGRDPIEEEVDTFWE